MMAARKRLLEALGKMWNWLRPNVDRTTGGLTDGWGRVVARIEGSGLPSFPAYFVIVGLGFLALHAVIRPTFPAPVDATSTRYLLSAVAQSVAALGALTFAVMFVSLQVIAPWAGPGSAHVLVADHRFRLTICTVIWAIGMPLALLLSVQQDEWCPLYIPITGLGVGLVGVVAIVAYVSWRVCNLAPSDLQQQDAQQAEPVLQAAIREPDSEKLSERVNKRVDRVAARAEEAVRRQDADAFGTAFEYILVLQRRFEEAREGTGTPIRGNRSYSHLLGQRERLLRAGAAEYELVKESVYRQLRREAIGAYKPSHASVWKMSLRDARHFAFIGGRRDGIAGELAVTDYLQHLKTIFRSSRLAAQTRYTEEGLADWEEELLAVAAESTFFACAGLLTAGAPPKKLRTHIRGLFRYLFGSHVDFGRHFRDEDDSRLDLHDRVLFQWVRVIYGLAVQTLIQHDDRPKNVAGHILATYVPILLDWMQRLWVSPGTVLERAVASFQEAPDEMATYLENLLIPPDAFEEQPFYVSVSRTHDLALSAHLLFRYCLALLGPHGMSVDSIAYSDEGSELGRRCRAVSKAIAADLLRALRDQMVVHFRLKPDIVSSAPQFGEFVESLAARYDEFEKMRDHQHAEVVQSMPIAPERVRKLQEEIRDGLGEHGVMRRLLTRDTAGEHSREVEVEIRIRGYFREALVEGGDSFLFVDPPPGLGGELAGWEDSRIVSALAKHARTLKASNVAEAMERINTTFGGPHESSPHKATVVAVVPANHYGKVRGCDSYVDGIEEQTGQEWEYNGRIGNIVFMVADYQDQQFRLLAMSRERTGTLELVEGPNLDIEDEDLAPDAIMATVTLVFRETLRLHLHEPDAYLFITIDETDDDTEEPAG